MARPPDSRELAVCCKAEEDIAPEVADRPPCAAPDLAEGDPHDVRTPNAHLESGSDGQHEHQLGTAPGRIAPFHSFFSTLLVTNRAGDGLRLGIPASL